MDINILVGLDATIMQHPQVSIDRLLDFNPYGLLLLLLLLLLMMMMMMMTLTMMMLTLTGDWRLERDAERETNQLDILRREAGATHHRM